MTFIGSFLSFVLAFILYRITSTSEKRAFERVRKERAVEALEELCHALGLSKQRLNQLEENTKNGVLPPTPTSLPINTWEIVKSPLIEDRLSVSILCENAAIFEALAEWQDYYKANINFYYNPAIAAERKQEIFDQIDIIGKSINVGITKSLFRLEEYRTKNNLIAQRE